jgi:hypothetical protein
VAVSECPVFVSGSLSRWKPSLFFRGMVLFGRLTSVSGQ